MSADYTTERYINDKGEIVTKITAKVNIPDGYSAEEYLDAIAEKMREEFTFEKYMKLLNDGILYGIGGAPKDEETHKWFNKPNAIHGREGTE